MLGCLDKIDLSLHNVNVLLFLLQCFMMIQAVPILLGPIVMTSQNRPQPQPRLLQRQTWPNTNLTIKRATTFTTYLSAIQHQTTTSCGS